MPTKAKITENFAPLPELTKADIGQIKIGGKVVPVTDVQPVLNGPHTLLPMVLLDSEQMLGAGPGQFDSIKRFFNDLPSNVEIGVGWLLQGNVVVTQPFTTDHDLAGKALIAKTRGSGRPQERQWESICVPRISGAPLAIARPLETACRLDVHRWHHSQ